MMKWQERGKKTTNLPRRLNFVSLQMSTNAKYYCFHCHRRHHRWIKLHQQFYDWNDKKSHAHTQSHRKATSNFISNKHIKSYWWTSNRQLCAIAIEHYDLCSLCSFRLRRRSVQRRTNHSHLKPLKLITSSSLLSRAMVIGSKQEFLWLNLNPRLEDVPKWNREMNECVRVRLRARSCNENGTI